MTSAASASVAPVDELALLEAIARRRDATSRHVRKVTGLLEERAELRGVIALADLIHDATRWAA